MVSTAESSLGYTLPQSLVALLDDCNGGVPARRCYPISSPTSWADDHIEIKAILGIGGGHGLHSDSGFDSEYMISEWEYPAIGIVLCAMPSGGHDAVMLDYSEAGRHSEPSVAYIDENRVPQRIASSFSEFITGLRDSDEFGS
ncbi:SMI1/KNR4 family protein [Glycomyces buryatensis]|uniref:SMI1/KNR4 family protein n=2 Tax=Glycomyces buryatensis TaxID=2570927 RepID=A0A4S8Q235_9ACTN|nr:SMI1/KNR4 family protein [Glycomyces buryatensis]